MTFCEQLELIRKSIIINGKVCSKAHFAKMIGIERANYSKMLKNAQETSCTEKNMKRYLNNLDRYGYHYDLEIRIVERISDK